MNISESKSLTPPNLSGTGYGRPKPSYNAELAEVGPGTPMGEYMRRFWHPIAISSEIGDLPRRVRMLCEDLVVFRDKKGRAGVVLERCAHRGASLYYGRVEEEGIRCCYHGWMFDTQGRCVDQPLEEGGGKFRDKIRQPWYLAQEQYGLLFVYMGPPDQVPVLPRYEFMENLGPDERLVHFFDSLPGGEIGAVDTSWLTDQDNIHDLGHAPWLHHLHSGPQFGPMFDHVNKNNLHDIERETQYLDSQRGMLVRSLMPGPFGLCEATIETQLPNVRLFQPPFLPGKPHIINWILPVDDQHHINLNLVRINPQNEALMTLRSERRDDEEWMQRHPSDYQAQHNQHGGIQFHSEEHLAFSDRGVVKMRRMYRNELAAMAQGGPLRNVVFEPAQALFDSEGGVVLKAPAPHPQETS